ncbi:alpha-glucoside-specific PTS transporter subunit IIBC [Amphibacillus sediminis]|uniref:alpha-glucoside-specific PTS transporter subunit IIBC n=1 Tax=Amphibacillus sediminis TaxID=360185 RepID=UPI0008357033|nr:alpha-glucoside-specific PTS transporter subunit IIBC [Amphibacillus sediminis]
MQEKLQRFGGAMFTPVLLFAFSGIMVALSLMLNNPDIVGSIANEGTTWHAIWRVVEDGAWTVFNQMELLFVIGIALGLAKMSNARAVMEAVVLYLTFNYFLSALLAHFGPTFGVDFMAEAGGTSGLKLIAGIKTLDTGIIGAILISALVVWIHNRYFETKLPEWLGIFQGSSFVVIIGFFVMIPIAVLVAWIWPVIQSGIESMQHLMVSSGTLGVWLYTFLERILIPTGLHHFVYTPFVFGPAVVEGGIVTAFMENLSEFASSSHSLKELFPAGGFALHGNSKLFAAPGIALAFYFTAKKENRKKVAALVIPATLTAVLAGITEPLEFTFLFVAPVLFFVHAILAATMAATMYTFGVVGDMGGGLIEIASKNWIPLFGSHGGTYLVQIGIGLIFTAIYFFVFRFLILKFNFITPGRSDDEGPKLYRKADYKAKKADIAEGRQASSQYLAQAQAFFEALGGASNIDSVNNCATRLRVRVKDPSLVAEDTVFKEGGAHGVVRNKHAFQVIVGLSVSQVREQFENLLKDSAS